MSLIDPITRLTAFETRIYSLVQQLERPRGKAVRARVHYPSTYLALFFLHRIRKVRIYPLASEPVPSHAATTAKQREVFIWITGRRNHLVVAHHGFGGPYRHIDVGQLEYKLTGEQKRELLVQLKARIAAQ